MIKKRGAGKPSPVCVTRAFRQTRASSLLPDSALKLFNGKGQRSARAPTVMVPSFSRTANLMFANDVWPSRRSASISSE